MTNYRHFKILTAYVVIRCSYIYVS